MSNVPAGTHSTIPPLAPVSPGDPTREAESLVSELGTMLEELEHPTEEAANQPPLRDNELVQVRLGIASALYTALRCKHAPTASHALRVALTVSVWAERLGLDARQRDVLEVAALLHDVGLIGVPDQVLLKPASLDHNEMLIVECARKLSLEILRQACMEPAILQIVECQGAYYDGSRAGYRFSGSQLPLGARMIAIAEAFDAMTSGQVYRRPMSQERAMNELFQFAGTQFDPELVRRFIEMEVCDLSTARKEVAARWLHGLDPEVTNQYWQLASPARENRDSEAGGLFQDRLLDNMHDAVVFIDSGLRITRWNHGAERLTGISESNVRQQPWLPSLLSLRDEKGRAISEEECPVALAIRSGVQSLRRLTIRGRDGEPVSVDSHIIPVGVRNGTTQGAILLMHDASGEASLEDRCQRLHEKATRDSLTQVANRAEFDRVHTMFVNAHRQQKVPCSLMICDLDHFKKVNDTYGHQAGDDVIKSLASVLKSACRPGDLVARYGGEEFVLLFANCDNETAARRSEQIRAALAQIAQPKLQGRSATASFGVTEIQPGDTAETMLRRADRALLAAKAKGRNCVVQLGTGADDAAPSLWRSFWHRKEAAAPSTLERSFLTPVPLKMAIEKLRGFVADHDAQILKIDGGQVRVEIRDSQPTQQRRSAERSAMFTLDLRFEEEELSKSRQRAAGVSRTKIHVTLTAQPNRDRRQQELNERAREMLLSFRSYLMAVPCEQATSDNVLRRATRILTPWLIRHPEE